MVLLLLTFFGLPLAKAQNNLYLNNNGSQSVSHGETINFYDEGGPSSGPDYYWNRWYKKDHDFTFVFNPSGDDGIKITFNQYTAYSDNGGYNHAIGTWALRVNDDHLYIYDGNTVDDSKLIADLTGSIRDHFSVMTDGPMTIRFVTNSSFNEEGWAATVTATNPFTPQAPIILKDVCGTDISLFALPGYDIYYTTNGNNPTNSSTPYDTPFNIDLSANNASVTVKAKAYKSGDPSISSSVASVTFTHADDVPTPDEPTIQFSGNTVTMVAPDVPSFLNETYNVYYTTTGDAPYTINGSGQVVLNSNATKYTAPFEWTTPNTTFKAFTWAYSCDNKYSGIVTESFGNVHVPTPTIVFGTTVDTIKCSLADVVITYTTNGTNPTASTDASNVSPYPASGTPKYYYLTIPHVAAGTTVKAVANKNATGFQASEIASAIYIPSGGSGTYGGIVLLDDREDHSWSYYSDASSPINSLNPADIKITYTGYGNNTMTTTNTDATNIPNSAFNANVASNQVAVNVGGENENQFIYLKTLEKDQSANNYPYTMIPNPFQKRPMGQSNTVPSVVTETANVVSGGTGTSNNSPMYTYYADYGFKSEYIIPASYFTSAGISNGDKLKSITLYQSSTANWTATSLTIKLLNSNTSNYSSAAFVGDGGTTVYTNSSYSSGSQSSHTFDFSTPFVYTGGNLVVQISSGHNGNDATSSWYGISSSTYQSVYARYNNNNATSYTIQNRIYFLPNTTFTVEKESTATNPGYRGFYAWRVKSLSSGLTIQRANGSTVGVNGMIDAEEEIKFITSNEEGNEVEFEALWALANVVECSTANGLSAAIANGSLNADAGYERNFVVVTNGAQTNVINNTSQKPVTISQLYPDGSGTMSSSNHLAGYFTANNDTKFENIYLRNGGSPAYDYTYYDAIYYNNRYYYINWDNNTISQYTSNATQQSFNDVTLYETNSYIDFGDGAVTVGNTSYTLYRYIYSRTSGTATITNYYANGNDLVFGRGITGTVNSLEGLSADASNVNFKQRLESGVFNYLFFLGFSPLTLSGTNNYTNVTLGCDYDRASNDNNNLEVIDYAMVSYKTTYSQQTVTRRLIDITCKSGSFQTAYQENDHDAIDGSAVQSLYLSQLSGAVKGTRSLLVEGGNLLCIAGGFDNPGNDQNTTSVDITIKGGIIRGSVYGGGQNAAAYGHRRIVATGGEIHGWVAGGCNGTQTDGGQTYGNTFIYIGGNTEINPKTKDWTIGASKGGTVFGAGSGIEGGETVGQVNNSTIVISDNAHVERNVYGGGNYGYVSSGTDHKSDIYILGGTVGTDSNGPTYGNVFGGSNQQQGQLVNIYMKGGSVKSNIYGGSNTTGTINGLATVNVSGGSVANVYGGGYGSSTSMAAGTNVTVSGGTVSNNVYGGGALGTVGTSGTNANTVVTVSGGIVNNVFGAGQGDASNTALISGTTTVNVNGGVVNGTVYGGGELGKSTGTATVNVMNGEVRGDVYAGALGTQEVVYVAGLRTLNVTGGHIFGNVYGGSKNANDALDLNTAHDSFETSTATTTVCATNISGGQLDRNVYAAGYFGRSFGSVYVFIGDNAITNAPNHVTSSVSHTPSNLRIAGSVWAGGDWGTFSGSFGASTITGYSNIYVDGTGYDVSSNDASVSNYMNIGESLLGCGTSCDAGKQGRFIIVRNYGTANSGRDFTEPYINATRTLYSIQRMDYLVLDNAHINFTGQSLINSMDETEKFSIHEIKEAFYLANGSSIFLSAPATQMKKFVSASCDNTYTNTPNTGPTSYTPITVSTLPSTPNKIRVNGGNYIKVYYSGATPGPFGELSGFAYMMASTNSEENTCAYARPKWCQDTPIENTNHNSDDGGFVSYDSTNNTFDINGVSHTDGTYTVGEKVQMAYENHILASKNGESFFRIWRNGGIESYREGIFNAVSKTTDGFSTVDVTIELPPFHADGVYYRIEVEDGKPVVDYGADILTFNAARATGSGDDWMYYNTSTSTQVTGQPQNNSDLTDAINGIKDNPDVNYGLIIMPTMGFAAGSQNYIMCYDSDPLLAANTTLFNKGADVEPQVTFRLTYYNILNSNASYDPMRVVLVQCDATGKPLDRVTIALGLNTITTIEQNFSTDVYAIMQGNGINNAEYTAKIVLPTFDIYNAANKAEFKVNSVSFVPANENETGTSNMGNLVARSSSFNYNNFAVTLKASDNTDHTNGWYSTNSNVIDAYPLSQSSPTPVTIGECDGRTMIALDFTLHYDGTQTVTYDKGLMGTLTFNIVFSNYKDSGGNEVNNQPIRVVVEVYRRGAGAAFYLDGQNGKNTNTGKHPDDAAIVLSTILNRLGYMPGDKIYVVNTVGTDNNLEWSGSKYGNITLYRYPGGHHVTTGIIGNDENTAFTGPLVHVTKNMTITDIILDGHGSAHGTDAAVIAQAPLITVANGATLELDNGAVLRDNNNGSSTLYGGAVNLNNGGTLMMNYNATITGNISSQGGGVYANDNVIVSKDVTVYDNHPSSGSTVQNNILLNGPELVIQIGTSNSTDTYDALTTTAKIGVTKALEGGEAGYVKVTKVESVGDAAWLEAPYVRPNDIIVHDGGLYQLEKYNDPTFLYWLDTWVSAQNTQPSGWGANLNEALANINTPEKLAWIISLVNGENGQAANDFTGKTINITADIDMGAHTWDPIGNGNTNRPFKGSIQGNGHVIEGVNSSLVRNNLGLFGVADGITIQNLIVKANFSGNANNIGTLVGTMNNGSISNCEAAGTHKGSSTTQNMGGLVGIAKQGTIHSSFAVNTMEGGSSTAMGGLVGTNGDGTNACNLYNSYANIIMSGSNNVGGLVGVNQTGCMVENCYAEIGSQTFPAFAASNAGTIQYCYANQANGYVTTNTGTLTGHGTYSATLDRKALGYMYGDNAVTLASGTSTFVHSNTTDYDDNHIVNWNGLLWSLNKWVSQDATHKATYTPWFRPISANINGDLPVLAFSTDGCMATVGTDTKFLYYSNDFDGLLDTYSSQTANIFLYKNATNVANIPGTNVNVSINEDVCLKQDAGAGEFINAIVGVTFDNSCKKAGDYFGSTLTYDWHLLSSPLTAAPMGIVYDNTATLGHGEDADFASMTNNYLPNTSSKDGWDLYTYYEPEYHWINLKRSSGNHWHYDDPFDKIDYTNETVFTPGKGYMVAINQDSYLNNKGTLNKDDLTIKLTCSGTEEGEPTKDWGSNLIGNPYLAYLDLNAVATANSDYTTFYIYDAETGVYAPFTKESSSNPWTPSQYIHPHQAFFVVATSSSEKDFKIAYTMATTNKDDESYFRGRVNYPLINLFVENENGNRDYTIIEVGRPELGGAEKTDALRNTNFNLYARYEQKDYKLLFTPAEAQRVAVFFKADEDGTYTLTWDTQNGKFDFLRLIDNITGTEFDMLSHDHYTFEGHATDYAARFYVLFNNPNEEDQGDTGEKPMAYNDGHGWIVNGSGQLELIDVAGHVLYSKYLAGDMNRVHFDQFATGVYVLKLNDKTQKIVIK